MCLQDDEEFRIDGGKISHNSLIGNVHLGSNAALIGNNNSLAKSAGCLNLARPRAERKAPVGGKWSQDEDNMLREIVQEHGPKCWKKVILHSGLTSVLLTVRVGCEFARFDQDGCTMPT